jgi:benzoate-CoA ligase family protein
MMQFPENLNMADYFLFDRIREGKGAQTAILWGEQRISYSEVADQSRLLSLCLKVRGVRRGERVLICLPDSPLFAYAIFGVLHRGAIVAMANPDVPAKQLEYLVEYTRATAVITIPRVAEALLEAMIRVGSELQSVLVVPDAATGQPLHEDTAFSCKDLRFVDLQRAIEDARPTLTEELSQVRSRDPAEEKPLSGAPVHRDEPAMWLFTSGSTGEPKANIHSHRDFVFNTEIYAKRTVGYREGDITLSISRLYFGYATGTNLFFPFAVGGTSALFSERPTPEIMAQMLTRYKPTVVTNVPTMLSKLLEYDESAPADKRLDLSSVRFSLSAGEALPEALLRRWQARFQSDVYDGIGSAEMFHIYASNRPGDIKPGSLGKAVDGYELRILPEEAEGAGHAPCGPGEIGVLWVKGDSVSWGYWLDRDKSWKTFHGHWCRTGDLFHIDEQGYLYFDGRADDLLKVGGLWVAPHEVEECIMHHSDVALAAVIGVEQDGLVRAKAFVVTRANVGVDMAALEQSLIEHLRARLAKYKVPKLFEFVTDLPKNDRGKVDRKALKRA